ncbi:hypothetical protein [Mycobacteroides abscessus]|uniref:hypothetical protein n=1 Tax=Mycobacteroides abscessus TaxID=36809 RepID=UPI0009D177E0|nr:hypothetical protein [Mycobacteroides abscessus]SLF39520.1 Uncharacterised protein [Mycobacteroides abscessus subsp. bolletii]
MKQYEVEINGYTTTLQLSDADAERRGLTPIEAAAKGKGAANKGRQAPQNKAGDAADASVADDKADGGTADQG